MERMMKSIRSLVLTALVLAALSTCSNPFNWVAEVTDEVMLAKDMYLQVTGVTPAKNEGAFSPEDRILIEFDREVDLSSVTAGNITFSPATTWPTPSFSAGTLTIDPDSLEGNTEYEVTIGTGIKGTDGSALRAPYVWKFTTTNSPSGAITIKDRSSGSQTYTNEILVDLAVSANGMVSVPDGMRYSMTPFTKSDGSVPWGPVVALVEDFNMGGSSLDDGVRTLYYQFRDNAVPTRHMTEVKTATITQDTTAPSIVLNNAPTYIGSSGWTSDVTVSEAGSGIASYAWSKYSYTSIFTLSPTDQLNTSVTPTAEGWLRLQLIATDGAGNSGYYWTPTITVDLTPPAAPTVTGTATPGSSLPTYAWTSNGGGNGTFRRNMDGGAWTEPAPSPYTPGSLTFGSHTLYAQERDDAGNWSPSGYYTYFYYPSFLRPVHASTGVSCTPLFVVGEGTPPKYTHCQIYGGVDSRRLVLFTPEPVLLLKTYSIAWATIVAQGVAPEVLPGSTRYYWKYVLTVGEDKPYTSPVYYFFTTTK